MAKRAVTMVMLVALAALIGAGCGSSEPELDTVRSCLEKLGMTVEAPPADDKDIKDGVFATTDLSGGAAPNAADAETADAPKAADTEFTFALAAIVNEESAISNFKKQSEDFRDTVDKDGKLEFESGTEGNYVWVAGGEKGSASFDEVRDCVEV